MRKENKLRLDLACQLHLKKLLERAERSTRAFSEMLGSLQMKRLAILAFVFLFSACLAGISWGQYYQYHDGGHSGYYRQGGSRTTVVVGFGNAPVYGGWGYGHQPYYAPRVGYYQNFGGYPVRYGYQRPYYPAPGCGYGYGGGRYSGGGIYFGW